MNAVEREPVETRVLNPTASEASYKPKQRIATENEYNKKDFFLDSFRSPNVRRRNVQRPNGGVEIAAPKRTRPDK